MHNQPMHRRHELSLLQLRLERKVETQRLDKLKANLQTKLKAPHYSNKPTTTLAA